MAQIDTGSNPRRKPPAAILHVPHCSLSIPPEVRSQFVLSEVELQRELLRMTDRYTDELFALDEHIATSVVFDFSRLVVDPERFVDDDQEPMAARGMGCVYTRTSEGFPLRQELNAAQRSALLKSYYAPHHARLAQAVQSSLDSNGAALIIDCHSFASTPLPHESDQCPNRPDICLGTDDFHTPRALAETALALFQVAGYNTALNAPFAGALVPMEYFRKDRRVRSIMIEVNRKIYLEEETGLKSRMFEQTRAVICSAVDSFLRLSS